MINPKAKAAKILESQTSWSKADKKSVINLSKNKRMTPLTMERIPRKNLIVKAISAMFRTLGPFYNHVNLVWRKYRSSLRKNPSLHKIDSKIKAHRHFISHF